MKISILSLFISLFSITGFSQNSAFEYTGRYNPAIKTATLTEADFVHEIMPEFNRYFVLPFDEYAQFDKQLITIYPHADFYPKEHYNYLFNYVSVEISTISDGKKITTAGTSDTLTTEKKNILSTAAMGTDIHIKIKFKYKNKPNNGKQSADKLNEGEYSVTIVPDTEAAYPGGFKQFTKYLTENVFNKTGEPKSTEKIQQAILKFKVDEEDLIINARIATSSPDPKIDELLLEATNKMPRWIPSQNSKSENVKQEFSIPLGGGGC